MCPSKQQARLAIPILTILLPLLLLCYGVGNVHCSTIRQNRRDLQALLNFKQGVSDPTGALSNWNASSHFCRWNGVKCTTTLPFRVLWLNLTGQSLSGQISSSLSNLSFLNFLDLSYNNFVGPLPLLGCLQNLQYLWLNHNIFSGNIPDAIITNFSNLTSLDLSSNSIVGPIPPKLGLVTSLSYLNLASNQLEGSIPGELGQLVNLRSLLLGNNILSGEVPHAIFSLSSLRHLYLQLNSLGKALPSNIGELLPNLKSFTIENNTFEGPIPASLGNVVGLQYLDLSSNNFTGKIPTSLGKLSNLTILNLQYNQLVARDNQDWEFLNALKNCKFLKVLSLAYNNLQGSIPQSVGNLSTSIEQLLFSGNSLSGEIPQDIGNLSALTRLALGKNNFSGTIDGWIENLKNLLVLRLQSNNFTGSIPSSIGNLTQLLGLALNENKFEGPIPAWLGNLTRLRQLGPVWMEAWSTCLAKSVAWELPGKSMESAWPGKLDDDVFGWKPVPEKLIEDIILF